MPDKKDYLVSEDDENSVSGQLRKQVIEIKRLFEGYKNIKKNLEDAGPSNAKGAAKTFNALWKKMLKSLRDMATQFLLGKKGAKRGAKSNNPLDLGLLYLTALLASLDLCSIIQTIQNLANQIPGSGFNPKADPPPNDPLWKIQKKAYDIQVLIDAFETAYAVTCRSS
jgi:hypothetical protein